MSISATSAAALTMPESTVRQGEEVTLPITLENNPGLISLRLSVTFGSNLELIGITNTERLNGWLEPDISKESPILFWKDSLAEQNNTESGVIANLIFKIKNNVDAKETVRVECLDSYRANGTQNSILAGETQLKITCANHSFGEWSKKDDNYHSKACKVCGTVETAEHTWDDGTVTKQPTLANSGEKVFTCTACGATKNEKIAPTTNIETVQITAKEAVIEKTSGYYNGGYYHYDLDSFVPEFTVTLKDGTVKTVSYHEFYSEFGFRYDVNSNQSVENEWGVGEHEFTVTIAGVDYPCKVTITESPIENVEIKSTKAVIEKTDGYDFGEYYQYQFASFEPEFTVTLKDKTVKVVSCYDFDSTLGFRYSVSSNQSAENEWGVGEHEFTVTIAGVDYPCKVTITEIENVAIRAKEAVIEKTGSYNDGYYEYFFHSFEPEFTVTLKDGTVKTVSYYGFYSEFGFQYDVSSNQSAENEWGAGEHEFTVTIAGVDYPCKVTITENPIKNVAIRAKKTVVEKNVDAVYNGEYFKYGFEFFEPEFTVTLKDKTVKVVPCYDFYSTFGFRYDVSSNQSAENEWGVGEHEFTVTIAGVDYPCKVTITESPIENVVIKAKKSVIEKTGGDDTSGYYQYEFNSFEPEFTVILKDGTVKTVSSNWVMVQPHTSNGWTYRFYSGFNELVMECNVSSNQSVENEWGIGEHEFTVTIAGVNYPCKVTVTESPIENVVIKSTKAVIEKTGGYDSGECYQYQFGSFEPKFTVTFKDGTVKTVSYDEFYSEFGFDYDVVSDNHDQWENEWGIGKHTFVVRIAGNDYNCSVLIARNPIKTVKARLKEPIIYNSWIPFKRMVFSFEVTFQNGEKKTFEGAGHQFIEDYGIEVGDYSTTTKGTFKTTVTFMGVTTDLWYTVDDSPYTNVTVSGNEEIIITLYKKDGTKEQQKVVSYHSYVSGIGGSAGTLLTDKGQYFSADFRWFEEPDEPADYTRNYEMCLKDFGVGGSIGQLWFQMRGLLKNAYMYSQYFNNNYNLFAFDGKVTADNVDAVLFVALQNVYNSGSNLFSLETAQSAVEKLFDLKGFDLTTAKSYNKEKGCFIIKEKASNYLNDEYTVTYNAETGWTFTRPNGDGTADVVICDQSGHIQKIAFGVQNIGHKHSFTATENLDGRFHGSSCTECGRFEMAQHHFHGVTVSKAPSATANGTKIGFCEECGKNIEFDIYASEFENYDIVENGKLDLVDVAKLAQYVAGWYGDIPIDYDYNEDDEVNLKEVVLLTRLVLN